MAKLILPSSASLRNDEPPHVQRLKSIGKWRLPIEGSQDWITFKLATAAAQRSPAYRKQLKDVVQESTATQEAVANNGAGFPADAIFREFLQEYNRRNMQHGLHYLPASFNIFEAFCTYVPKHAVFLPNKEVNCICSLSGFLDFIHARVLSTSSFSVSSVIQENTIIHYSFVESVGDWIFCGDDEKYVISSVSMIRHGDDITVVCLGGRKLNLKEKTESLIDALRSSRSNPNKPDLEPDPELQTEAVALDEGKEFWRTVFAFRYNINRKNVQARYVIEDAGNSWMIKTDDPITTHSLAEVGADQGEYQRIADIERFKDIFSFMIRFLELPRYFAERKGMISNDRSITSLRDLSATAKGRNVLKRAFKSQMLYEQQVQTLLEPVNGLSEIVLPSLELKVEVDGYWERLPIGSYGEGPDGERILGRTWVRKTLSKRSATLSTQALFASHVPNDAGTKKEEEGYIYVLRNASHQIDMFKVGLTRRDAGIRAAELSRTTGVPDAFLVVQTWWVPNVVIAEKRIHELLDEYRVRSLREFFRADYVRIRAAIDLVINEMCGRNASP